MKRSGKRRTKHLSSDKLLRYTVKGRSSKLKKWLKRDSQLAQQQLPDGSTALHQACRHGHLKVVKQLLKCGADAQRLDVAGCTSGHVAAMHGHSDVLAALLQSAHPPNLDLPDNAGVTIRHLLEAAAAGQPLLMHLQQQQQHQQHRSSDQRHRRSPAATGNNSSSSGSRGGHSRGHSGERDDHWRAKLQQEMSDDEAGGIGWARYRPEVSEDDAAAYNFPGLHLGRDDAWAEQLWREMLQRRARAAAPPVFSQGTQLRQQAAAERAARAAQAAASSARILREEQAKEADWRAAMVAQVQQATQLQTYQTYQAKWGALESTPPSNQVTLKDIPWPVTPLQQLSPDRLKALLLQGCSSAQEVKKRLKQELMRWHPDKFSAKFAVRVAARDKEEVVAGVQSVAQCLTQLLNAAQDTPAA